MAGRTGARTSQASVRPNIEVANLDGEEEAGEMTGHVGERIGLPKEDEVVRKLADPRLPSQEEVDRHYVMGHLPYRNWCPER